METLAGQYLDLLSTASPTADGLDTALRVCRLKTAAYTVQRPLQVGALLAGAVPAMVHTLGRIGLLVGEAFQLRDDLLGVFGDPARTGKSALDDLRDGKNTALLACARDRADPDQARLLADRIGDPDLDESGAAQVRSVLVATGARDAVEAMITCRCQRALATLATARLHPSGTGTLRALLDQATSRDH